MKKKESKKISGKPQPQPPQPGPPAVEDQRERGYYYDDSHGYQKFDPNAADDKEEDKLPESE